MSKPKVPVWLWSEAELAALRDDEVLRLLQRDKRNAHMDLPVYLELPNGSTFTRHVRLSLQELIETLERRA